MRVYGLCMVRNEADVIRINVLYHLSLGFDRLLIADNGSTDGTVRELRRLGGDRRVGWSRYRGGYDQGEALTRLARQAHREGANWVAPIDADEFWHAPGGGLREVLQRSEAPALRVGVVDYIQRREQERAFPDELLHMTRRVAQPTGRGDEARRLIENDRLSFVELARVPKVISRTAPNMSLIKGASQVDGVGGETVDTDELRILHAPLRSRQALETRALSASRRGLSGSTSSGPGWHARRWSKLRDEGRLGDEWAANSYAEDRLDVHGERHSLVFDPTLRDAVAPFVGDAPPVPLWKRLLNRR